MYEEGDRVVRKVTGGDSSKNPFSCGKVLSVGTNPYSGKILVQVSWGTYWNVHGYQDLAPVP